MKKLILASALMIATLTSCGGMGFVTSGPNPFSITPSRAPAIVTATPLFIIPTTSASLPPPPTWTTIAGPTGTSTNTPTAEWTYTPSPSATATPFPVEISLLGCETGFDVTHGMGEVTNAYVIISNRFAADLTNACTTLSAADEGRVHPDKTVCIPSLPRGFRVVLKLTIDTTFQVNTIVSVAFVADQGFAVSAGGLACNQIGGFKPADDILGIIQDIP